MTTKELFYARRFREEGMALTAIARAFQSTPQAVYEALRYEHRARALDDEKRARRADRQWRWRRSHPETVKRQTKNQYRKKCGLPPLRCPEEGAKSL